MVEFKKLSPERRHSQMLGTCYLLETWIDAPIPKLLDLKLLERGQAPVFKRTLSFWGTQVWLSNLLLLCMCVYTTGEGLPKPQHAWGGQMSIFFNSVISFHLTVSFRHQTEVDRLAQCGLNEKCPLQTHLVEHLAVSWWCCLGKFWRLRRWSLAERSMTLEVDFEVLQPGPLPALFPLPDSLVLLFPHFLPAWMHCISSWNCEPKSGPSLP